MIGSEEAAEASAGGGLLLWKRMGCDCGSCTGCRGLRGDGRWRVKRNGCKECTDLYLEFDGASD